MLFSNELGVYIPNIQELYMTNYLDPYHFKQGFHPKCPHCKSEDIKVSLSEYLYGPCNGQYEVIYCGNHECHAFLAAVPTSIMNVQKGIPEGDKIKY
ncbi:hypothetical protein FP742_16920 [Vibrio parahaemolyticus]|uniref:Uncharacterized protein n=3 Tax=Vibrio parahaemolyticus TaxID=670 RepID=A0A227JEM4_VIBPH|nr:hypothetical protein A6J30_09855 [Vibrio parahaemolyticus]BAC61169.1 hypothetical protein [Vibrio parahaemolyticus RIMD 2210633]AZV69631.1 hypothetical protein D0853_00910 [Vibrio parahaemolyticus]EGQ8459026.1 hypothetical protein [Vibrio parahaemolyticus]EGQ8464256.1 hypothetical protein [Vibrio parahaemolyticus]